MPHARGLACIPQFAVKGLGITAFQLCQWNQPGQPDPVVVRIQALKPEEVFVLKHADLFALRPIHAVILRIKRKGFAWFQGLSLHYSP